MEQQQQCDRKEADGKTCGEPAKFSYAWDWGETGVCCAKHQTLQVQQQQNLGGRVFTFHALQPTGPVPMTRDERSRLKGEVYALEEEVKELKVRGLDLYNENVKLAAQVQSLTVRNRELVAQSKDAAGDLEKAHVALAQKEAEHGDMADELTRLRTLSKFSAQSTPAKYEQSAPADEQQG